MAQSAALQLHERWCYTAIVRATCLATAQSATLQLYERWCYSIGNVQCNLSHNVDRKGLVHIVKFCTKILSPWPLQDVLHCAMVRATCLATPLRKTDLATFQYNTFYFNTMAIKVARQSIPYNLAKKCFSSIILRFLLANLGRKRGSCL